LPEEKEKEDYRPEEKESSQAVEAKLLADLRAIERAVETCCRCPGGGKGIPGCGEPGAEIFILAGKPGPGAVRDNPWGAWRDVVLSRITDEWGWEFDGVYLSTALRCPLQRATREEVRRCAGFLAEELFLVGPRLVVVSGRVAAVALRAALGDGIPKDPKAGDTCTMFSMRFLFDLDIARIDEEKQAAAVFWHVLIQGADLLDL
jgi:uracil-DNA glycosylase